VNRYRRERRGRKKAEKWGQENKTLGEAKPEVCLEPSGASPKSLLYVKIVALPRRITAPSHTREEHFELRAGPRLGYNLDPA
jgi:hypothetical protein